jgi:excinuclease UvrABC nuclease subunit
MDSKELKKKYSDLSIWESLTENNIRKLPFSSAVYFFRTENGEQFGRLKGSSDLLYIGCASTRKGINQRMRQYLKPGKSQWTNQRINSMIDKYKIEFSYIVTENPQALELSFLRAYIKDHDELPPLNRSSGRIWKLTLKEKLKLNA